MSSPRGLSSELPPLRPNILQSFSEPSTAPVVDALSRGAEACGCAQRCVYNGALFQNIVALVIVFFGCVLYYSGLNTGRYPLIPVHMGVLNYLCSFWTFHVVPIHPDIHRDG